MHTYSRSTIMAVLGMSGSRRLNYEPGDHVAIFPQNNHKVVTTLIDRLNPSISPDQPIFIESRRVSTSGDSWVEDRRMPVPVTLREALTYYLDITNPPSAQFLKLLAKQATRLADQEDLNDLAKGGDIYEDWKYERFPSFCDVMDQFPSLKVDVTLLLQQLPLLQCVSQCVCTNSDTIIIDIHIKFNFLKVGLNCHLSTLSKFLTPLFSTRSIITRYSQTLCLLYVMLG